MTQVSAAMIKDLRGKTGAGMMDCKKALEETEGDIEGAVDWLRTKGLASAAKKAASPEFAPDLRDHIHQLVDGIFVHFPHGP